MIFLDLETKTWSEFMDMKTVQISYLGIIDDDGTEIDYWEKDIPNLKPKLENTDWVVGYNSIGFDLPIIGNYLGTEVNDLPQIDLMIAIFKTIGFRPKLNDVVTNTLGRSKIAKGSDATIYWANQDLDSLKKYGMEDVRLTKELYDFGIKEGYIKYTDKQGFIRKANINWDLGKKVKKEVEQTLSLF